MLKLLYSLLLTTLLTNCKAQETTDEFQQSINEMREYKPLFASDDDFETIENRLVVDITGGIKKIKVNNKTVDSVGFRQVITQFLNTHKNKESLLIAGSLDHASLDNMLIVTKVFNECKTECYSVSTKSKIYFKTFKDFDKFKAEALKIKDNQLELSKN
jgi:hypothetical protein